MWPIEVSGTVLAAIGALVAMFGLGLLAGWQLPKRARRSPEWKSMTGSDGEIVRWRETEAAVAHLHEVARGYQAHEAIDMLRALAKILKRGAESRGPEPAVKMLGNSKRMQTRTAPPAWESGEREIDGRGPAGLCEARNQELEHHQNLLAAKLVDPPETHAGRSFDEDVALARQRRLAEPASPLPKYTDKQLQAANTNNKQLEAARQRPREEWGEE